ncbi:hypothetical protein ACFV0R_28970 [Streptomyces sp. NPDC059578]|uniref:hypothetical protein n=1 Tax=Streptomyces sp. NPDC059578 TaxID=3346874 RepID=UPI00369CE87E
MNTELLHGDLCPLYHRPLTLRITATVRSAQSDYPTRIDTVPHCDHCADDVARAQKWAGLMLARYES